MYHVDHPGINAMSSSIRQKYFWDGMYQTIEQFVSLSQLINSFIIRRSHNRLSHAISVKYIQQRFPTHIENSNQ